MATATIEQKQEYIRIIDAYLRNADLATVSARTVRKHLEEAVGHDLKVVKDEIKQLITERFDQILAEQDEGSDGVKTEDNDNASLEPGSPVLGTITLKAPTKRKQNLADDARFAAKLHEELNAGRPSRSATAGSGPKRKPAPKKKSIVKKKKQVESDMSGEEPEKKKRAVNRNNPFNAPMQLSEALSDLIGKSKCSRPECVKSIWAYVKENGLQDPSDKRFIICDDSMKRVFNNAARVHMFTMNKVLSSHIFPLPKAEPIDGET